MDIGSLHGGLLIRASNTSYFPKKVLGKFYFHALRPRMVDPVDAKHPNESHRLSSSIDPYPKILVLRIFFPAVGRTMTQSHLRRGGLHWRMQ
jgi:hypothetical protein